jgi:hypothetical protein
MDQRLDTIDDLIAEIAGIPIEELAQAPTEDGRHLISVDELRAAGALDVPAAWRKSLAQKSRYTLPGFGDDEEHAEPPEEVSRTDSAHDSTSSPTHRPRERKSESTGKPR